MAASVTKKSAPTQRLILPKHFSFFNLEQFCFPAGSLAQCRLVTVTVILLTNQAPSVLAAKLSRAGIRVYEALAISEVLALVAEHPDAQIVITSDVEPRRVSAIQEHHATLVLNAGATAADLIWELEQISPRPALKQ
jgi:hypothetical protein